MSMSSAGRAASSSDCDTRRRGHEIGLIGSAVQIQRSSLTGSYAMATAEHREPYESRGSRTVLGAPGGEIPPGDSSTAAKLRASKSSPVCPRMWGRPGSRRASRSLSRTCPTWRFWSNRCRLWCRRLMTVPGIGPVVALTYRAAVDVPARFRKSESVGAVFGLTCAKYQSGEIEWNGRISRCGDEMMRIMLYEAAQSMLVRSKKWSWLKAWAMQVARRRGMKKAIVALARRLAVIMHRIWVDGTEFRWTRQEAAAV